MTTLEYATERRDIGRINKLNGLTNIKAFWADVKKLTKNTTSDHALNRWQALAEIRYDELKKGEKVMIISQATYDRWKKYAEELGDDYTSEADFEEWVNRQIEIAEELL